MNKIRAREGASVLSANDVASVILARSGPWTDAMKLQKLLYYAQAWHLAITDEPLFYEQIKAWKDGPVVPQVWHERRVRSTRTSSRQQVEDVEIDSLASELVDLVIAGYGSMSGDELSALTHVEDPWAEARGDLPPEAECREAIRPDTMARFYRSSRMLGGRTAADWAATGVHAHPVGEAFEAVNVSDLFASIEDDLSDSNVDEWGGANLLPVRQQPGSELHSGAYPGI